MENSRSSDHGFRLWIAMVAMTTLAFATGCRGQSVYTVGEGNITWEVPPSLSFFQDWVDGLQLFVNDSLYFAFDPTLYDVRIVATMPEFVECETINPPLGEDDSGDALFSFTSPGTVLVMSQSGCDLGMKFQFFVSPPGGPIDYGPDTNWDSSSPTPAPSVAPGPSFPSNDNSSVVNNSSVPPRTLIYIPWRPYPNDSNWASSVLKQPLEVDSYLVFLYSRTDNLTVYRVEEEQYNLCDSTNSIETVTFGESYSLPQPGSYYFIDGNPSLCQNSSMRLLVYVPGPKSKNGNAKVICLALVIVSLAVVLVGFIGYYQYRKQTAHRRYQDHFLVYSRSYETKAEKAKSSCNKKILDKLLRERCGNQANTLLFTLKELEVATRNFSRENELGKGAFGTVYKGNLKDGRVVAVKRANAHTTPDIEQFVNEVSILSQVNHRNLVKLLGCCLDLKVPLLVYEFIPNGTLQEHLELAQQGYPTKLDWPIRFKIAVQTAEALMYLHSQAMPPIVHRDVKAANILLDDDFGAKVADFGLSKLVDVGATHISTAIKGTPGYLDPEYYFNSQLTDKSDVYSYGIVLLELITSEKPVDLSLDKVQNLALRSVPVIKSKRVRDIMDIQLQNGLSKEDFEMVEAVAEVAVACLMPRRASRPTMTEVVEMLQRIRGSKLQAGSFYIDDESTSEGHLPGEQSLPFSNLSRIFRSFNWTEQSFPSLELASDMLARSSSSRTSTDRLLTSPPSASFVKESLAPR